MTTATTTETVMTSLGFKNDGGMGGDYWIKDLGKSRFGNRRDNVLGVDDGVLEIIGKPMSDLGAEYMLSEEGEQLDTERGEGNEPITAESLEAFCRTIINKWS